MSLVQAICPVCKQRVEVNSSEEAHLCKLCGKPFATKEAIELYTEHAETDHKLSCEAINLQLKKDTGKTFSGELAYLKQSLGSIENRLYDVISAISLARQFPSYVNAAVAKWEKLVSDITQCKHLQRKEFDDKYILYTIDFIDRFITEMTEAYDNTSLGHSINMRVMCGRYIADFVSEKKIYCGMHDLFDMTDYLAKFLSTAGKKKLTLQRNKLIREREKAHREHQEKRYKEAYEKELPFWQEYVDFLKAGKVKAAFEKVNRMAVADLSKAYTSRNLASKQELCKTEVVKFKKGLFGYKYTGDISAIKAETFAELAAKE